MNNNSLEIFLSSYEKQKLDNINTMLLNQPEGKSIESFLT